MTKRLGTQLGPMPAYMRHVINALIANPRRVVDQMKKTIKGASRLKPIDFEPEGRFGDVIRFRIDVKAMNKVQPDGASFPGTSFIEVKLSDANDDNCKHFEQSIKSINGVIEWDRIDGDNFDYLVRAVNYPGSTRVQSSIRELSGVKHASASRSLSINHSGVVDNFTADDFLVIESEGNST